MLRWTNPTKISPLGSAGLHRISSPFATSVTSRSSRDLFCYCRKRADTRLHFLNSFLVWVKKMWSVFHSKFKNYFQNLKKMLQWWFSRMFWNFKRNENAVNIKVCRMIQIFMDFIFWSLLNKINLRCVYYRIQKLVIMGV